MKIQPKNWNDFQHYKDRSPSWIKLHRRILDDYEYHCLPLASKAIAPFLWLLASEYIDGIIDGSDDKIAFRLRLTVKELKTAIEPLISSGFFTMYQDASITIADCNQDACLEKRREETYKEEKEKSKRPYGQFENVLLSDDECKKLVEKFGNDDALAKIDNLSAYMASKRTKYISHYATILTWAGKDKPMQTGRRRTFEDDKRDRANEEMNAFVYGG